MITVSGLFVYPLKGGRGIPLDGMELDPIGPVHDRRWMVVDPAGALVTQREISRLCQVAATPEAGGLRLEAPGLASLLLPSPPPDGLRRSVRVWRDICDAVDQGDPAARWLSRCLDASVRLVYLPESTVRRTDPAYDSLGGRVGFADGFPLLLIGEASLADLNARLEVPLPMNRFRPNVVVRGAAPFAEDGWRRFEINGVRFDGVKPCARCTVPTTDQDTGERGPEPLRTLATFRKRGSGVLFGMNVVHRRTGWIRLGDGVMLGD